jgi:hypothetical protein
MGHIVTGVIVIVLYYIISEYLSKRSFVKEAESVASELVLNSEAIFFNVSSRENTLYYIFDSGLKEFKSINGQYSNLLINELNYANQFRFKQLLLNVSENLLSDKEFFIHNQTKHLLFSFQTNEGTVKLLLLVRNYESLDSLLQKKKRK